MAVICRARYVGGVGTTAAVTVSAASSPQPRKPAVWFVALVTPRVKNGRTATGQSPYPVSDGGVTSPYRNLTQAFVNWAGLAAFRRAVNGLLWGDAMPRFVSQHGALQDAG